jgi:uncharacterized BrkB/YihY/UPF0761 family membrane protein
MPPPDPPHRPGHGPSPAPPLWLSAFGFARRVKAQVQDDHVGIVSAGVAFYFFLALFPLITTLISVYGLWSANRGSKALFRGVNVAYDVTGRRGLVRSTLLSAAFTTATLLCVILALLLVAAVPSLAGWLGLSGRVATTLGWLPWPILAVAAVAILMLWFYLTAFSILRGAEIDSELERVTSTAPAS